MHENAPHNLEHHEHHQNRKWSLKMIFLALVLTLLFFGGGVVVGRGGININGLSVHKAAAAGSLNYSSVNQIYDLLKKDYDGTLDTSKLINGAKQGLVAAAGDPYTVYFDLQQAKDFNNELQGTITGIGAEIGSDAKGNILIVSPISGYPAAKAGLKPKDIVAAIDGKSTAGISVEAAVSKIRGPVGTKVRLTIIRGEGNPFDVTITRQKITVPSVTWKVESNHIGYIKISQFTDDTDDLASKAASEFKSKGVKGVVLDLRGNPGGYLDGAVNVSSLWLNQGDTVVSERRGSTIIDTRYATGEDILRGLPTVVLIDGGSASASEITAGALHDNNAASLLGEKSFGKGSVQQVENLSDGSELKVTVAHWYTPDGININKKGIEPDIKVDYSSADAKAGRDPQKSKAYQILLQKM